MKNKIKCTSIDIDTTTTDQRIRVYRYKVNFALTLWSPPSYSLHKTECELSHIVIGGAEPSSLDEVLQKAQRELSQILRGLADDLGKQGEREEP